MPGLFDQALTSGGYSAQDYEWSPLSSWGDSPAALRQALTEAGLWDQIQTQSGAFRGQGGGLNLPGLEGYSVGNIGGGYGNDRYNAIRDPSGNIVGRQQVSIPGLSVFDRLIEAGVYTGAGAVVGGATGLIGSGAGVGAGAAEAGGAAMYGGSGGTSFLTAGSGFGGTAGAGAAAGVGAGASGTTAGGATTAMTPAASTGGAGSSLGSMLGNVSGRDWASIISGIYGMSLAGDAQERSDPFGPYRGQYAAQMQALEANPGLITSRPGYNAGLEAVQRQMQSKGYLGSGNHSAALMEYSGGFFDKEMTRLGNLAGAGIQPGNSAYNSANLVGQSLASIGYGMAPYLKSGGTSGGGSGGGSAGWFQNSNAGYEAPFLNQGG